MVVIPICQLAQVSFNSKITLVHVLCDSPNDFSRISRTPIDCQVTRHLTSRALVELDGNVPSPFGNTCKLAAES